MKMRIKIKLDLNKSSILLLLFFELMCSYSHMHCQINFENLASDYGLSLSCGDTFLGNGVSFVDFDGDGWDDLTFATDDSQSVRFFKNFNGVFSEHYFNMPDLTYQTKSVNWIDYDNDGDKDLFITSFTHSNRLLRNDGNSILVDVTVASGFPSECLKTYGASWGDINNDGYLDVFLSSFDPNKVIPNLLFKNNGDGTFANISMSAGISNVGHLSFCSALFDYDNDGDQDIYISNDRVINTNILYLNNGDETFTDVSVLSGTALSIDAMSVTVDDFNSDGWFDIYITNTASVGNFFLMNNGNGTFTNISDSTGTEVNGPCWGAVFLDADNDRNRDLYVSSEADGSTNGNPSVFFRNLGGQNFISYTNNFYGFFGDINESYSNAIGDVDNDGFPDIIVTNSNLQNVDFWKNNTNSNNKWLKVKLEGTLSNKDGIGSVIEISANGNIQYNYTLSGEGYLSQNSLNEFFGLANNAVVDYVKVKWLSGIEDVLYNVNTNQEISIIEGETLSLDASSLSNIKIHPNPVFDRLYIENTINSNLPLHYEVYDILGNIIIKGRYESSDGIILKDLNKSIYIIKIYNKSNLIQMVKIIKK